MSLTPAERAALDALNTPDSLTLDEVLTDLDVSPGDYWEAINAERDFPEYLLAVAIQDLYIADSLADGQEVINIARKFWPMPIDINEEN